jgi:hypothetical protein
MRAFSMPILILMIALLAACTKAEPPVPTAVAPATLVDTRSGYLREVDGKIGEWRQIVDNLKANRNMQPVNSDLYKRRGETIDFLEAELAQVMDTYALLKAANDEGWSDVRPRLDAKLADLKERYFRPTAE